MSTLSALTLTAAILTACLGVFYLGGKAWERRYGPSTTFTFSEGKPYIAGAAIVTAVLLVLSAIVGF